MTFRTSTPSFFALGLALAALAMLFVGMQWLPAPMRHDLLRENGPIEMLTVLGYVAAALALLVAGGRLFTTHRWYLPFIIVVMGLRELDFDKRFTTMGILKSGFYLSAEVPLAEKLVGLLVVGLVAAACVLALHKHAGAFLRRLRALRPDACAIGLAIVFVVISKSIDGLARKLAGVGIAVGDDIAALAHMTEELLEFGIPLMLGVAAWSWWRERTAAAR